MTENRVRPWWTLLWSNCYTCLGIIMVCSPPTPHPKNIGNNHQDQLLRCSEGAASPPTLPLPTGILVQYVKRHVHHISALILLHLYPTFFHCGTVHFIQTVSRGSSFPFQALTSTFNKTIGQPIIVVVEILLLIMMMQTILLCALAVSCSRLVVWQCNLDSVKMVLHSCLWHTEKSCLWSSRTCFSSMGKR